MGIFVNEAGSETLVNDVQSLSKLPTVSSMMTPSGNSILLRDSAPEKAPVPEISLRVDGRLISERLLHLFTIEFALISSTPSSKMSFSSALAFCSVQLKFLTEPGIRSSLTLTNLEKFHPLSFSSVSGRSSCSTSSAEVPPRKPKAGNLIRLPFMLDRAWHAHFSHAAFGDDARDFRRAVNRGFTRESHTILNNVEFLCNVCSRCRRTRVRKCNVT